MAEEEINDVTLELPQEHREASAIRAGARPLRITLSDQKGGLKISHRKSAIVIV